jgi:organic radical activating enzyme
MAINIKIKGIRMEDFTNYKKPSMYIAFPSCTFKCERECGKKMCQNSSLVQAPTITTGIESIVNKYINNPITSAIVIGGLEPFDSEDDLQILITYLRVATQDDIIIYTGYTKEEIQEKEVYKHLLNAKNIVVKFGRFIPDQQPHYDEVLGISLASDNQYAERIS